MSHIKLVSDKYSSVSKDTVSTFVGLLYLIILARVLISYQDDIVMLVICEEWLTHNS